MGTYNVTLDTEGHKVVQDGDWTGELVGACDANNMTMRIPRVHLSKEEAQNIREDFELGQTEFHLDANGTDGTYCFLYENRAINNDLYKNFNCSYVNESNALLYFKKAPFLRRLPIGDDSRCIRFSNAVKPFADDDGLTESVEHALIYGTGFVVSGIAFERLMKKITGKSLFDLIKNGKGPKGPSDPLSPGGSSPSQTQPSSNAPAPDSSEPARIVRLPDIEANPLVIPPPEPWQAASIIYTAAAAAVTTAIGIWELMKLGMVTVGGILMIGTSPEVFGGYENQYQRHTNSSADSI